MKNLLKQALSLVSIGLVFTNVNAFWGAEVRDQENVKLELINIGGEYLYREIGKKEPYTGTFKTVKSECSGRSSAYKRVSEYEDGKLNGLTKTWSCQDYGKKYSQGTAIILTSEGEYVDGLKDGLWTTYHERCDWLPSHPNKGCYVIFHDPDKGGQIATKGEYDEGLRDGDWEFYSYNGKPSVDIPDSTIAKGEYDEGLRDGDWEFYFNHYGEKHTVTTGEFDKGLRDGDWEFYIVNVPVPSYSGSMQESKKQYETAMKDAAPELYAEGEYDKGLRDGDWEFYHVSTGEDAAEVEYEKEYMVDDFTLNNLKGDELIEGQFDDFGNPIGEWAFYHPKDTVYFSPTKTKGWYSFLESADEELASYVKRNIFLHPEEEIDHLEDYLFGADFFRRNAKTSYDWSEFNEIDIPTYNRNFLRWNEIIPHPVKIYTNPYGLLTRD